MQKKKRGKHEYVKNLAAYCTILHLNMPLRRLNHNGWIANFACLIDFDCKSRFVKLKTMFKFTLYRRNTRFFQ